jgi:lysophospholipase L1-like esterase
MGRVQLTAGLVHSCVLALAVGVCGCGHSSDTTGPSSGTTAVNVDFGSNTPRTISAFGDSITFGVLEERKIRANLDTANNYPNVLQGLLQRLDPAWRVTNAGGAAKWSRMAPPGSVTSSAAIAQDLF